MKKVPAILLPLLLSVSLLGASVQFTPSPQPIPSTFFGLHFQTGKLPWPSIPVGSWRLWDSQTRWPDIEPSKGDWRFDTLDKDVSMAEQHNTDVLLTLGVTPQWASAHPDVKSGWQQPGLTSEPLDLKDWRAFVQQVATRYKGRIHAYEIWNEPNLKQYWVGNMDQMIDLVREAHDVVKGIDPTAIIVSPAATTGAGMGWLDDFLRKGGGRYVDVIGYHFYVYPQPPEAMVDLIQRVKQTLANDGAADKPIWNTEIGWAGPKPFPSEEMGAAYIARAYTLSWAAGVTRLYWYSWYDHKWVSLETTEADNQTLKPAGQAYGIIQQWLSGARMDWCNRGEDGTWNCQLDRGGAKEWIVWNSNGMKTFAVPSSWHVTTVTSLLGEPQAGSGSNILIGPTPLLLTSSAR
jgi:glycosyl hydrolase family 39 (putative alpha-L-iduronidase)